jgi:hypothetical protein
MAELASSEAERQLTAAAERHREVVAAVATAGRSDQSQRRAAAALGRGVQLLTFTVTRAAATGLERERIAELIGSDGTLVDDMLDRGPDASVIDRLTPAEVDRRAVAQATASFEASVRVGAVVQAIMADIEDRSWSPASADLDDLAERIGDVWRRWRQDLGRRDA